MDSNKFYRKVLLGWVAVSLIIVALAFAMIEPVAGLESARNFAFSIAISFFLSGLLVIEIPRRLIKGKKKGKKTPD